MKQLIIYEYQAKQIQDTLRMVANALKSEYQATSLDRDIMQSMEMITKVVNEKIDEQVSRF